MPLGRSVGTFGAVVSERGAGGAPTEDPMVRATSPTVPFGRWLLALGLVVVNVADVAITKAILSYGGSEANPIMSPIIDHPSAPILIKTLVAVLVGVLLIASPTTSRVADRGVMLVLALYVVILGWNTGVLLQAVEAVRY